MVLNLTDINDCILVIALRMILTQKQLTSVLSTVNGIIKYWQYWLQYRFIDHWTGFNIQRHNSMHTCTYNYINMLSLLTNADDQWHIKWATTTEEPFTLQTCIVGSYYQFYLSCNAVEFDWRHLVLTLLFLCYSF